MAMKKNGKKSPFPAVFLLFLGLAFSGCGRENRGQERTLTDPSGGRVMVPPVLERIVSTAPSNTEIIAALGFADKIVAMDKYSASVEGITGEPVLIDFAYPDGEVILGLEPDIIFAAGHNQTVSGTDPFKLIRETGTPVIYIPTSHSIAGIYRDIRFIAGVLGVPERGETLAGDMREQIEAIGQTASAVTEKTTVYFEISPFPYMVTFGEETFLNEMITVIGAVNIFAGEKSWFSPAPEAVIERNPGVILTLTGMADNPLEDMLGRPGFGAIHAVKNNRVYSIDADSASRPSHHIVLALKQMAAAVYPDLFPAF
ncbi:MAG: ABC transporter substrate-binding protein [Treponema sp.]|jgi:iron complex transport system substrate-binding protein|nr:ABC transporter substrate-binding protein [Treponema sp.]